MPIIKNTNLDCGPVILCGDFNGESHEKVYEVISGTGDMATASAYRVTMVDAEFGKIT